MEKFLHIHLLISTIFSILLVVLGNEKSFSPLNSSYIMEARKRFMSFDTTKLLDPPMPSYTFALYNRHLFEKSKFRDYDSLLESKLARSQARANHLASILQNGSTNGTLTRRYNNGNVPKTTSTNLVDGEYVASFTLGTEQVKAYLLIDTGSDLVWWQCGPCEANKCYTQNDPIYDSTKSKTYRKLDCIVESSSCLVASKVYECTEFGNQCLYDYKYVEGSITKGWIGEEVITFVLDQNPVRILFGCGIDQTSGTAFGSGYSGIVGIGRRVLKGGGYSLPSQFQADIMAMCLPGTYSTKGSTISFHTTPFKKKTSADLLQNYGFPTFYFVNLYKIFINDKEVPFFPSLSRDFGNYNYDMTGGCIVDTGTIISRFPRDFYTVFRDTYRNEARDIPMMEVPLGSFDTCFIEDPGVVPNFPVVKMYFGHQSPDNLLLLQQQRVVVHIRGLFCLAFLPWDQSVALIGNNQLQGVGLTFDTATDKLYFDLDACN